MASLPLFEQNATPARSVLLIVAEHAVEHIVSEPDPERRAGNGADQTANGARQVITVRNVFSEFPPDA